MEKFIAYFDYLGFKDFIENNDTDFQTQIMRNNFRDIEIALGKGETKPARGGVIADLGNSSINCMNFSDTVVFWTNDKSINSLNELLAVAYRFNWHCNGYTFPLRGAVVLGEIVHVDFRQESAKGGIYNINSLYGKGLVNAHLKADSQHWAGTVIDESVVNEIKANGISPAEYLTKFATLYKVPYKVKLENQHDEYVLNLVEGKLNEISFPNVSKHIVENFGYYNKSTDDPRVQEKINNTLEFLKIYL